MVVLALVVACTRAVVGCLPEALWPVAILVEVYILAVVVVVRELIFEFLNPKTYRQCVDSILASRFLDKRINQSALVQPVAVVTGADGTIGNQIVLLLIKLGFSVHALVGNAAKMRKCMEEWTDGEKARVKLYQINFAEPLRAAAYLRQFKERIEEVDLIVLAAGTMLDGGGGNINGIEHTQWVNVVSQAAVFGALEGKMVEDCRIVALSSVCARLAEIGCTTDDDLLRHCHGSYEAYARSKLLLSLYCERLAHSFDTRHSHPSSSSEVRVISVHPGVVAGGLYRHANPLVRWAIERTGHVMRSPEMAAALVLRMAMADDAVSGGYYEDGDLIHLGKEVTPERREKVYDLVNAAVDDLLKE